MNFRLFVGLFLVSAIVLFTLVDSSRKKWGLILEGTQSTLGQFQSYVYIRNQFSARYLCSGGLITLKHVLSSAVCAVNVKFTKPNDLFEIIAGSITRKYVTPPCQVRLVREAFVSKKYTGKGTEMYDVGVLEAEEAFDETEYVYFSPAFRGSVQDGMEATAVGYGGDDFEDDKILLYVKFKIDSKACQGKRNISLICIASSKNELVWFRGAGLGGPVYVDDNIVGVASHVMKSPRVGLLAQSVSANTEFIENFARKSNSSFRAYERKPSESDRLISSSSHFLQIVVLLFDACNQFRFLNDSF